MSYLPENQNNGNNHRGSNSLSKKKKSSKHNPITNSSNTGLVLFTIHPEYRYVLYCFIISINLDKDL